MVIASKLAIFQDCACWDIWSASHKLQHIKISVHSTRIAFSAWSFHQQKIMISWNLKIERKREVTLWTSANIAISQLVDVACSPIATRHKIAKCVVHHNFTMRPGKPCRAGTSCKIPCFIFLTSASILTKILYSIAQGS